MDFVNTATELKISEIITDAGTQARFRLDANTVREYMREMSEGANFPAVDVFNDGSQYVLADGFHRIEAAKQLARKEIIANVKMGSVRDAILHAAGANNSHGLRRTRDDLARSIIRLLEDDEWGQWSDREIARRCKCHHATVAKYRKAIQPEEDDEAERTYTRNGKETTMKTGGIGGTGGTKTYTGEDTSPASPPAGDADSKPKGQCTICGRPLSDPDSIARGMGDVCAGNCNGNGASGGTTSSTFVSPTPPAPPTPAPDVWMQLWDLLDRAYEHTDDTIWADETTTIHEGLIEIIGEHAPDRVAEFEAMLEAEPADEVTYEEISE